MVFSKHSALVFLSHFWESSQLWFLRTVLSLNSDFITKKLLVIATDLSAFHKISNISWSFLKNISRSLLENVRERLLFFRIITFLFRSPVQENLYMNHCLLVPSKGREFWLTHAVQYDEFLFLELETSIISRNKVWVQPLNYRFPARYWLFVHYYDTHFSKSPKKNLKKRIIYNFFWMFQMIFQNEKYKNGWKILQ